MILCYRQHQKKRWQGFCDIRRISHIRAVRSQECRTNCRASSARIGGSLRKNVSTLAQARQDQVSKVEILSGRAPQCVLFKVVI